MTDILTWSISLGRWSGVQIRIHNFLIFFAVSRLVNAAIAEGHPVLPTLAWLAILLVVLILHEAGHAVVAMVNNLDVEEVRLWPLGNFVLPGSPRSVDSVPVAVAGLAVSGFLALCSALMLFYVGSSMVFNPFGHGVDGGAPFLMGGRQETALRPLWWLGCFGYLNWVVFLANLIPALPMDMGRILRSILARNPASHSRDNPYAQWTGHSLALILAIVGAYKMVTDSFWVGVYLVAIGLIIELIVRSESRVMDDGGFFDDGIFGYDFTEGYTSLEGSAAKVRPYRESAIKRWRRKRSELRRQRRVAREIAEDRRMDEILEKIHILGKSSLTDEEHRFLVRVSTKLRNRPRARD